MKIAIINSVYKTGSTGRISFEMNQFFLENGHESAVFIGRGKTDGGATRFGNTFEVLFHFFSARALDSAGFIGSKKSTKRLIKYLDDYKPDIIVANNLHGYYLNLPVFFDYLIERDIKIIFVLHDCWLLTGHCAYFDLVNCDRWKTSCGKCPNKYQYPKSLFLDRSTYNYARKKSLFRNLNKNKVMIVTPSNWLFEITQLSFLRSFKSIVIHNGIDTNLFNACEETQKIKSEKKTILLVANIWTKAKGLYDIKELSHFFENSDVQIVVIGKIKNRFSFPSNVLYVERTDNLQRLIEYYHNCDVFFNPTYEDNYPTVNLEALACRLPVVSYETGGSCEAIDKRYSVNKGDIYSACQKIKHLFSNPSDYIFPSISELSKEATYAKYLELLNCMANES